MLKNDAVPNDSLPSTSTNAPQPSQSRAIEIPNALPMHPQLLDVVRHTVIDPDGKRYVVATYNDKNIGRGYVTAVFPQQNDYLTMVRMTICEFISLTEEKAVKRHITVVQTIQQGRLEELIKSK